MSALLVYILKLFRVKPNKVPLFPDSPHAAVSWVCGWMLNCTEEPPPIAPHLTTNRCPPSRTSTSTVWRFGPSSSSNYSSICCKCQSTLPSITRVTWRQTQLTHISTKSFARGNVSDNRRGSDERHRVQHSQPHHHELVMEEDGCYC